MRPIVSIIICTRNRCRSLDETLSSLLRCHPPQNFACELLVVDNGSSDETRQVVDARSSGWLKVDWIPEPRIGQCYARNTGLKRARGDVVLFTDDDVVVPEDWILRMPRAILEGKADAVAGGVDLDGPCQTAIEKLGLRPFAGWWASTEQLDPHQPERMVGANMAFSRSVAERIGGFDTNLGPGALGFADETLFSYQVVGEGFRLVAHLDTPVVHRFDLQRLTRASILESARSMGRSRAYLFHHWFLLRSRLARLHLLKHWGRCRWFLRQRIDDVEVTHFYRLVIALERLAFCREYLNQKSLPPKYLGRRVHAGE